MTNSGKHNYEDELDELRTLKKEDSYFFSYPFSYIAKNHGNDRYDDGVATMEVRVDWDDAQAGYVISYSVPDMHKIDPAQGNSDAQGFYDYGVYDRLMADLAGLGISPELIAS